MESSKRKMLDKLTKSLKVFEIEESRSKIEYLAYSPVKSCLLVRNWNGDGIEIFDANLYSESNGQKLGAIHCTGTFRCLLDVEQSGTIAVGCQGGVVELSRYEMSFTKSKIKDTEKCCSLKFVSFTRVQVKSDVRKLLHLFDNLMLCL